MTFNPASGPAGKFLLPADCEELVISYLSNSFSNVGTEMTAGTPLPFILVTLIDDPEDMVTAHASVQIDAFQPTMTLASTTMRQVHLLMKNLVGVPVLMSTSGPLGTNYVSVDCIEVHEGPHWEDYGSKEIKRYCARYCIGRRCNLTS
jgi:hypothetical protein